MFKKVILLVLIICCTFVWDISYSALEQCKTWQDISALQWCLWDSTVVQPIWWNLEVAKWFKEIIINFIKNVWTILALAAIGFIAYGSMVLVASWWNDEKIKKWKNIIKWSLVWFLWLVSASWIIALIVNLIYWFNK